MKTVQRVPAALNTMFPPDQRQLFPSAWRIWDSSCQAVTTPNVFPMLGLGFGSGLPYLLISGTLGFWLREMAAPLALIGALSWATLPYALKVLWAKFLDDRPALLMPAGYGQRRGWILLSQMLVMAALLGLALAGGWHDIRLMAIFCLTAAIAGASQDIAVDAFRIESGLAWGNADTALTAYQFGYRIALLLSDGAIFIIAGRLGWPAAYVIMAALMILPIIAAHMAKEGSAIGCRAEVPSLNGAPAAVSIGGWAFVFAVVAFYRLPDLVINPMINPLYHDMGVGKDVMAGIHVGAGITASFLGIAVGGAATALMGLWRALLIGAALQVLAVASFSAVAFSGGNVIAAACATAADTAVASFTGVVLVAFMSRYITPGRAGMQFAALTCAYALFGKLLGGFSGLCVASVGQGDRVAMGYGVFFLGAAFTGLPAAILIIVKLRKIHG